MKYPAVYIEWFDAQSEDNWHFVDELEDELPLIRTLGFLLREHKDRIVVAQNLDSENESTSMVMTIPRAWIKRKRRLKLP